MAISITNVKSTPHVLLYLLEQDGAVGAAALLDNAAMVADLSAGPLREMQGLGADVAGVNSQAVCRKFMLGDGADVSLSHAQCSIEPREGDGSAWTVDATVDGTSPQRAQLVVTSQDAAGTAYLRIQFEHSLVR